MLPNESKVTLDNLMIAAPCNVGWENMTGTDTVRHCHECKLNVYNISRLTAPEAERLLSSEACAEGKICFQLYRRHDGTILTADCPQGLRKIRSLRPKILRTIAATVATFIATAPVYAQDAKKNANKSIRVGESLAVPGVAFGGMMGSKSPETFRDKQAGQANWTAWAKMSEGQKAEKNGNLTEAIAKYKEAEKALRYVKHDPKLNGYVADLLRSARKKRKLELEEQRKAAREKVKSEATDGAATNGK